MDNLTEKLLSKTPPLLNTAPTAISATQPKLPSRESGWAGFFQAMAVLSLLIGVLGVFVAVGGGSSSEAGLTIGVIGVASGIQMFFMAFMVTVFTEMRWYLAKISAAQNRDV